MYVIIRYNCCQYHKICRWGKREITSITYNLNDRNLYETLFIILKTTCIYKCLIKRRTMSIITYNDIFLLKSTANMNKYFEYSTYLVKDEKVESYSKGNDKENIGQNSTDEKYKIDNGCKVNGQSSSSLGPRPCFISSENYTKSRKCSHSNLEVL